MAEGEELLSCSEVEKKREDVGRGSVSLISEIKE